MNNNNLFNLAASYSNDNFTCVGKTNTEMLDFFTYRLGEEFRTIFQEYSDSTETASRDFLRKFRALLIKNNIRFSDI